MGLYHYGARFYDPQLGRFVAPDTIIPQQQGTQAWDRYAGMNNNPIKYTDPTGHDVDCSIGDTACLRRVMIEQAIETFDIDVSHISGFPEYNPGLVYDGATYPDSSAAIGPPAFSSAGHLGSTIGHENIHGIQIDEGRYYTGSS